MLSNNKNIIYHGEKRIYQPGGEGSSRRQPRPALSFRGIERRYHRPIHGGRPVDEQKRLGRFVVNFRCPQPDAGGADEKRAGGIQGTGFPCLAFRVCPFRREAFLPPVLLRQMSFCLFVSRAPQESRICGRKGGWREKREFCAPWICLFDGGERLLLSPCRRRGNPVRKMWRETSGIGVFHFHFAFSPEGVSRWEIAEKAGRSAAKIRLADGEIPAQAASRRGGIRALSSVGQRNPPRASAAGPGREKLERGN